MRFPDDVVLAERARAFERLIAGATHEANNTLTTIQGLAMLLRSAAVDPEAIEDLDVMVEESRRAIAIMRTLRSFAGRSDSEPQPCSLNDTVGLVADIRRYECRARGMSLDLQLDPDLLLVVAEPTALLHVVLLPVLQAEDAVAALSADDEDGDAPGACAGRIAIATSASPQSVTLTVTDTGVAADGASLPARLDACRSEVAAVGGDLRFDAGSAQNTVTIVLPAVG